MARSLKSPSRCILDRTTIFTTRRTGLPSCSGPPRRTSSSTPPTASVFSSATMGGFRSSTARQAFTARRLITHSPRVNWTLGSLPARSTLPARLPRSTCGSTARNRRSPARQWSTPSRVVSTRTTSRCLATAPTSNTRSTTSRSSLTPVSRPRWPTPILVPATTPRRSLSRCRLA